MKMIVLCIIGTQCVLMKTRDTGSSGTAAVSRMTRDLKETVVNTRGLRGAIDFMENNLGVQIKEGQGTQHVEEESSKVDNTSNRFGQNEGFQVLTVTSQQGLVPQQQAFDSIQHQQQQVQEQSQQLYAQPQQGDVVPQQQAFDQSQNQHSQDLVKAQLEPADAVTDTTSDNWLEQQLMDLHSQKQQNQVAVQQQGLVTPLVGENPYLPQQPDLVAVSGGTPQPQEQSQQLVSQQSDLVAAQQEPSNEGTSQLQEEESQQLVPQQPDLITSQQEPLNDVTPQLQEQESQQLVPQQPYLVTSQQEPLNEGTPQLQEQSQQSSVKTQQGAVLASQQEFDPSQQQLLVQPLVALQQPGVNAVGEGAAMLQYHPVQVQQQIIQPVTSLQQVPQQQVLPQQGSDQQPQSINPHKGLSKGLRRLRRERQLQEHT